MKALKTFSGTLSILLLIGLSALGLAKAQAIQDWWRLRDYQPPASISALAAATTMTPQATHVFYVNHPQLFEDVNAFRSQCSQSEKTIVLGCYHPDQEGINVYDVKDERLHGVEEVTAAHEMLHAAYDRLSSKERDRIDGLLQAYFKNQLDDQRVISTINSYKETEPNDIVNEMHSIFGTEIAQLPQPLEDYYKRYFADRPAVVRFADSYKGEFTKRIAQINAYDVQLAELKARIEAEESSLEAQASDINAERARMDSLRNSNRIEEYNAAVPGFNAKVEVYNRGVRKLQADIAEYNQMVEARNSIASELRSLDQSIDTRLTTQPGQ